METLLHNAVANVVVVAAAAPIVWLATRALKRPAVAHGLWLLLLLKLLTPPMWSVPVRLLPAATIRVRPAVELPLAPATIRQVPPLVVAELSPTTPVVEQSEQIESPKRVTIASEEAPAPETSEGSSREPSVSAKALVRLSTSSARPTANIPAPKAVTAVSVSPARHLDAKWIGRFILAAWGCGSLIYGAIVLRRLLKFRSALRWAIPASPEIRRRVEMWVSRVGLKNAPVTIMTRGALSPMVWGPFRPRLLLPIELWEQLGEVERDSVILHELAHLARRDHWVRCAELMTAIIYWWFPLCWWLRHELHEAEEQCCDAWVLWMMPGAFRNYAGTILQTVDFLTLHGRPGVPALASGMGQFRHLKRRLVMLKRSNVSRALTRGGVLMILGTAGLLLPLTPVIAQTAPAAGESAPDVPSNHAPSAAPSVGLPGASQAPVDVFADQTDDPAAPSAVGVAPVPVPPGANNLGGLPPYSSPGLAPVPADPSTPDEAAERASRAGAKYRIVSVDATQHRAKIADLERKIADEQLRLANDMRALEMLRSQLNLPVDPLAAGKDFGEIMTQVLPDGRVVTMRRAVTDGDPRAMKAYTSVLPPKSRNRDERLAQIERQLQALLNEVDRMRYEKTDGGSGAPAPQPTPAPDGAYRTK